MDPSNISDKESLYRVVRKSYPDGFIDGKPTAALFIDAGGVSVDRDGERAEDIIVSTFKKRFSKADDYKTSVKINAGVCRAIGTYPNPVHNRKNKYHAEIHESATVIEVTLIKAMQLASKCTIVGE